MSDGIKPLSTKEKRKLQKTRESLTITPKRQQFEKSQFQAPLPRRIFDLSNEELMEKRKSDLERREKKVDSAIQSILKSAREQDSAEQEMDLITTASSKSSWLITRTIPKQSDIGSDIELATTTFRLASLSDSQKTKRGKKFEKKAAQQAKMINLMNQCHWQRDESLNDLLEHGKNARLGADFVSPIWDVDGSKSTTYRDTEKEGFLETVGSDLDQVSVEMTDLSFYFEQKRGSEDQKAAEPPSEPSGILHYDKKTKLWIDSAEEREEKALHPVTRYHYKPLELIADPATRTEGYLKVLEEFEKLDLSIFDYKDNDDFMKSDGDRAFVKRYAALRAFSHARDMILSVGRAELGEKRYLLLNAKADVVSDILKDYNNRALLIQSPYYVLLAGKDFDALSDDDIRERIDKTEDILAKSYMKQVLEHRGRKQFGKGSKARDILKDSLKGQAWRAKRDKEGRDSLSKRQLLYSNEKNQDTLITQNARTSESGLMASVRKLTSFLFRKKNALPIKDADEKKLEFEADKAMKGKELSLDRWGNDKFTSLSDDYYKAALAADRNFLSFNDSLSFIKREFIFESDPVLQRQKNDKEVFVRKDYTGVKRRSHLKKYKNSRKYTEAMVEEDVNNLVLNILDDNLIDRNDIDLNVLEDEFISFIRAYPVFSRYCEGSKLVPELEAKRCENMIENLNELIEKEPERKEELEKDIEVLEGEMQDFLIRKKTSDAFVLKVKNKTEVLKKYWMAKQWLRAITEARLILDNEEPGEFRDSMIRKLEILEDKQSEIRDYNLIAFRSPTHSALKVEDPFTAVQTEILATLSETNKRIDKLKKMGKAGEEEALKLLDEARRLIEAYDDPEYAKRLKITG